MVEITGFMFANGELHLFANNVDDRKLQILERNRYDDASVQELEFVFTKDSFIYLKSWLKRQKVIKESTAKTFGEAVKKTVGTITIISGKYLKLV